MVARRIALPLLAPVTAGLALAAASVAAPGDHPTIKRVSAKRAAVGQTLTIEGSAFRKGRDKNVVVFKTRRGPAVFVRARRASATKLTVVVPANVVPYFRRKDGVPQPTRFYLRVLAERFGERFTPEKISPMISPSGRPARASSTDCDGDGIPNGRETDADDDLLPDAVERSIGTDPCRADTDGDGMTDGWEQYSAVDFDPNALPSPERRPYPNALDPTDTLRDPDGDGILNAREYAAWATYGRHRLPLLYSGGTPTSAGRDPLTDDQAKLDLDGNGLLTDNERLAAAPGV
jgi:hypothetical protein